MPLPLKSGIDMSKRQKKLTMRKSEWEFLYILFALMSFIIVKSVNELLHMGEIIYMETLFNISVVSNFCKESIQSADFCQTVAEWSHPFQLHEENLSNQK